MIEIVKGDREGLAIIVYKGSFDEKVKFITPETYCGNPNSEHQRRDSILPHMHPNLHRTITQSQEMIHVVTGKLNWISLILKGLRIITPIRRIRDKETTK